MISDNVSGWKLFILCVLIRGTVGSQLYDILSCEMKTKVFPTFYSDGWWFSPNFVPSRNDLQCQYFHTTNKIPNADARAYAVAVGDL